MGLLWRSFDEDPPSEEVTRSFSLGVFITMLPTLGVGFLVFFIVVAVSEHFSKLALLAAVVVFNPIVKWGVYVLSFGLGALLLGPVDGVTTSNVSLTAAPDVVLRLVVGNVLLASVTAVGSYPIVYRIVERYGDDAIDIVDEVSDRTGLPVKTTSDAGGPVTNGTSSAESDGPGEA